MPTTNKVSAILDLYFFIRMFSFVPTPVSFTALRLNLISWSVSLDGWLSCNFYTKEKTTGFGASERVWIYTKTQLWKRKGMRPGRNKWMVMCCFNGLYCNSFQILTFKSWTSLMGTMEDKRTIYWLLVHDCTVRKLTHASPFNKWPKWKQ